MPTKDTVEVDKVDKAGALNNTVEENQEVATADREVD